MRDELNFDSLKCIIAKHSNSLSEHFSTCFPDEEDPRTGNEWVRSHFSDSNEKTSNSLQKDQLIELSNNKGLESLHKSTALPSFWIHACGEFPELSATALKLLMPFSSTYQCEARFNKD